MYLNKVVYLNKEKKQKGIGWLDTLINAISTVGAASIQKKALEKQIAAQRELQNEQIAGQRELLELQAKNEAMARLAAQQQATAAISSNVQSSTLAPAPKEEKLFGVLPTWSLPLIVTGGLFLFKNM